MDLDLVATKHWMAPIRLLRAPSLLKPAVELIRRCNSKGGSAPPASQWRAAAGAARYRMPSAARPWGRVSRLGRGRGVAWVGATRGTLRSSSLGKEEKKERRVAGRR
jgi:hypothetical protein